ncbi:hypothetical protein AAHA92_25342 [Salvia divinorum]|uniref:Uncharacterized protein n=1 Tax=Salvia divinorum TaxID=28513 RepID=A0ABD1GAI3_SALDI
MFGGGSARWSGHEDDSRLLSTAQLSSSPVSPGVSADFFRRDAVHPPSVPPGPRRPGLSISRRPEVSTVFIR